ncbi:NADH:flavin oxidoreductase/NADH oxidase [Salipiger abyssi]|uniref:NADH:flavin oxidoreductase/NADH oxidase n=1 Tax=Salipiger abyssi TaxID=1250539 RepID=UPI001A904D47|nr:NADH:flavin oxidoreductase/NADH oxidase [Salipiger abyssi]MBN9890025.1 NADH:flavin oxidoreductase/NADH oxidase [Salipiger abyssi]
MTDPTSSPAPMLFEPLTLRGVTARNRIVVSPMCQYVSVDGGPSDWHLVHLGKFAMGGAGIVFGEETSVERRGRKTYGCAGIYEPHHVPAYRRINEFLLSQGALPAIQLGHSGRKASCQPPWTGFRPLNEEDAARGQPGWQGLAPSPIPTSEAAIVPHEMDRDDIQAMLEAWREATLRSAEAGFEVCEVHGAHGYLIQQFLSPITNKRTDGYGGDRAGRMRLALEITETVRAAWPDDKPLFFRVSAVDGKGGHWDIEDTVALSKELKARGVDVVDCSSGGINGPLNMAIVKRVPGYQVPFAETVKKEAGIMTQAVGLITEAAQAEAILQEGKADLIALARELLLDPNWPVKAARDLGLDGLSLLPDSYSWWLARREQIRAMSINRAAE